MALTLTQKKAILKEIAKGTNGVREKSDMTEAKIAELSGYLSDELDIEGNPTGEKIPEELDVRFDFTRIEKYTEDEEQESPKPGGDPLIVSVEKEREVVEDMYCVQFFETEDAFVIERDMLANYEAGEKLSALEAKAKVVV